MNEIAVYSVASLIIVVALMLFQDSRNATFKRFLAALPVIHEAIVAWVARADAEYDQIYTDYADKAAETGRDPRLLWVIDQVNAYALRQFKVKLDLAWLIVKIEEIVANNKKSN